MVKKNLDNCFFLETMPEIFELDLMIKSMELFYTFIPVSMTTHFEVAMRSE